MWFKVNGINATSRAVGNEKLVMLLVEETTNNVNPDFIYI